MPGEPHARLCHAFLVFLYVVEIADIKKRKLPSSSFDDRRSVVIMTITWYLNDAYENHTASMGNGDGICNC